MTKSGLDTAQDITSKITSVLCSLSSMAIIAMVVSTDPSVRKGSMGVIAAWFVFCLLNIIVSSLTAEEKGISLIESVKGVTSTGSSSFSSLLSSSSFSSLLSSSSHFIPTSSSSFISSTSSGSSSR